MEFSRQEYWSRLPCPPSGDLPYPGIKSHLLSLSALADRFFTISATWGAQVESVGHLKKIRLPWGVQPGGSTVSQRHVIKEGFLDTQAREVSDNSIKLSNHHL